jgi:hypothetical protein
MWQICHGVNSKITYNITTEEILEGTTVSHRRDTNIRRYTNISGKKRNRRNINNSRTPATAEI